MDTVKLKWHGPYLLARAYIPEIIFEKGIYAISRKWGNIEKLLYVGRTLRSLEQRVYEHEWWLRDLRGKVLIRYGVFDLRTGQRFSKKKLADVEALLITWHQPPENTMNGHYYYGRPLLTVINSGRRGLLCSKVSTLDLEDA